MLLLFPLALLGAGLLLLSLFGLAVRALPIGIGVATAASLAWLGLAPLSVLLAAIIAATITTIAGRLLALRLPSPLARTAILFAFAFPAALIGFSVGHAIGTLIGPLAIVFGLAGGAGCAFAAARTFCPPHA